MDRAKDPGAPDARSKLHMNAGKHEMSPGRTTITDYGLSKGILSGRERGPAYLLRCSLPSVRLRYVRMGAVEAEPFGSDEAVQVGRGGESRIVSVGGKSIALGAIQA